MAKYDEKFKQAVVKEYLAGSSGYKALQARHGVGRTTIKSWVDVYRQHGDAGLRKKFSHYSARFKLSVLKQMWRQELSCCQAATLFDLRGGAGVVSAWERRYHEGGLDALEPKPRGLPKAMKAPEIPKPGPAQPEDTRALEDLYKENEYLRAEVAYLKKLEALVRVQKQAARKKRKP